MTTNVHESPEISAKFRAYGCKLDREAIERLLSLVTKNFPADARITVSTERESKDISISLSGTSLDQLLDSVGKSVVAGDLRSIDNLFISVRDPIGQSDDDRAISVWVTPTSTWGTVKGADSAWVRGKAGEIRDLLRSFQPRWVPSPPVLTGLSVSGFALYVIAVSILLSLQLNHFKAIYAWTNWCLVGLFLVSAFVLRKLQARTRTRLVLMDGPQPMRKHWVGRLTLVATLLILAATVAGTVYTMIQ